MTDREMILKHLVQQDRKKLEQLNEEQTQKMEKPTLATLIAYGEKLLKGQR